MSLSSQPLAAAGVRGRVNFASFLNVIRPYLGTRLRSYGGTQRDTNERDMNTQEFDLDEIRQSVRGHYSKVVAGRTGCGCSPTCCGTAADVGTGDHTLEGLSQALGYSAGDVAAVPDGANLGLGCGNPVAHASIQAGHHPQRHHRSLPDAQGNYGGARVAPRRTARE